MDRRWRIRFEKRPPRIAHRVWISAELSAQLLDEPSIGAELLRFLGHAATLPKFGALHGEASTVTGAPMTEESASLCCFRSGGYV